MDLNTPDLPSKVEESLSSCPQFRILLIGNTGVGKSSLVQRIFKINPKDIDIAHDRAGRANIEQEYTSQENTRFILHDSQGFEAGSVDNLGTVEEFLRSRSKRKLSERVHALWLCIPSPCEGTRLLQAGDEKVLALAKALNIPVIIVFTKYDVLVSEHIIKAQRTKANDSDEEIERKADLYFERRIEKFEDDVVVKVSTSSDYPRSYETLRDLTKATYKCLNVSVEEGPTISWVIAQRINTSQKVGLSIREGFKKYWLNLGSSIFFQGRQLKQCVWRIHDDIVKIWNFHDPDKLLSREKFFADMIKVVSPILNGAEGEIPRDDTLENCLTAVAGLAPVIVNPHPFAIVLGAVGVSALAIKFLYGTYKKIPTSARYLGAYITALTSVFHLLFQTTVNSDLSEDLINKAVTQYTETDSFRHHNLIRDMGAFSGFEKKIANLIVEYTGTEEMETVPQNPGIEHGCGSSKTPETNSSSVGRQENALDHGLGRRPGKRKRGVWEKLFGKS